MKLFFFRIFRFFFESRAKGAPGVKPHFTVFSADFLFLFLGEKFNQQIKLHWELVNLMLRRLSSDLEAKMSFFYLVILYWKDYYYIKGVSLLIFIFNFLKSFEFTKS